MRNPEASPTGPLAAAVDRAIGGDFAALEAFLCKYSRMPGDHPNLEFAASTADMLAARGRDGEKLALRLACLSAEDAPATTAREFLPMCGVLAVGACAAKNSATRQHHLHVLHELAEDFRYRVRALVPTALARIGEIEAEKLFERTTAWREGYFHCAALLLASAERVWLSRCSDAHEHTLSLEAGFSLLRDSPRSMERYPGYKALADAIPVAVRPIAQRFGGAIFQVIEGWTSVKEPVLRQMIEASARGCRTFAADDTKKILDLLSSSAPIPRDPTLIRKGMRSRGKKRRT